MIPSSSDIRALLKKLDSQPADALEGETLEFKSWDPAPSRRDPFVRAMRETVVAFANMRGGVIVVGVHDRPRSRREAIHDVRGLEPEDLRRQIYHGTAPPVLVDVEELIEPEGRLLLVRVPRGVPPHTTTDGLGKVRVGKENRPLTGDSLSRLYFSGSRDLTAEVVPGATWADLDPEQIRRLQRTIEAEGSRPELAKLPAEQLLSNLHLVEGTDVTLSAILLLGRATALARWAPQHEVIFLRQRSATAYDARHEFKGPLLETLDAVQKLLSSHLSLTSVSSEGFLELTLPDLTWWSAREAILNALVHRDYFLGQSVQIEVHRDRVLVSSPGGFIGGVSPANVIRHPPARRNSRLADVMQTIGFVNRAGLGADRICEQHLRLGKPMPRWDADESHVRLTLVRTTHEAFARFVADERRNGRTLELNDLVALRCITERGGLDRWSAAERLQLSPDEAASVLVDLRGRGYLVAQGRGRGTSYRLARGFAEQLRGRDESGRDIPLDDEAVRLRVQAVLAERGRLTNDDIRRISDYSRTQVLRLMRELREQGLAEVQGRGRAAHYVPGPKLASASRTGGRRRK